MSEKNISPEQFEIKDIIENIQNLSKNTIENDDVFGEEFKFQFGNESWKVKVTKGGENPTFVVYVFSSFKEEYTIFKKDLNLQQVISRIGLDTI
jgi:hypothetical protein